MAQRSETTGACVLLTGPPGAGKTTIGVEVVRTLREAGRNAELLDEHRLDDWLGPAPTGPSGVSARTRMVRIAQLLARNGVVVVLAAVTPSRSERESIRAELGSAAATFVEAFVDTPDHLRGDRTGGTVALVDYEEPIVAEVRVLTHDRPPRASAAQIVSHLEHAGFVGASPSEGW